MKPTYLYVKLHATTGKLYFGKTVKSPLTYEGSGLHWKYHISKHGKQHVKTLWYQEFTDQESLTKFATEFSKQHDIVNSDVWLNLKEEDGLMGGSSKDHMIKMRAAFQDKLHDHLKRIRELSRNSPKQSDRILKLKAGSMASDKNPAKNPEHLSKMRKASLESHKALYKLTGVCPHCGKAGSILPLKRWHFDNCKKAKS